MNITRKRFLKVTGISALAVAGKTIAGPLALAREDEELRETASTIRWAMIVDLVKCAQQEGCTDCIQACHEAHNVPHIPEHTHRIEWIWKNSFESAFPSERNEYQAEAVREMPVPLLCNHCDNPPCVRVCPTKATWRQEDGLVMMDWHRCIGCRYCMAACPYGSRSFNWTDPREYLPQQNMDYPTRTTGVVEKCTFCDKRLAKGELPACVDACPQKALAFGNLGEENSQVRQLLRSRYAIRRKPELGTKPVVFYLV
jgi:molybdopterin-containing oxidoreductase family iron-sulfur binding subunit